MGVQDLDTNHIPLGAVIDSDVLGKALGCHLDRPGQKTHIERVNRWIVSKFHVFPSFSEIKHINRNHANLFFLLLYNGHDLLDPVIPSSPELFVLEIQAVGVAAFFGGDSEINGVRALHLTF